MIEDIFDYLMENTDLDPKSSRSTQVINTEIVFFILYTSEPETVEIMDAVIAEVMDIFDHELEYEFVGDVCYLYTFKH